VHTSSDHQDYVSFLEVIPAFASCTRNVLKDFVTHDVIKVRCKSGETFSSQTSPDNTTLYVLVAGTATLSTDDDLAITLEPGDYFGPTSGRHHMPASSVVAVSDIELLAINPHEATRLQQASSRDRHPSKIAWRMELPTTARRISRRNHRRSVLAHQGMQ
jgi:CRP-like cAMP-binding protein